MAKKNSKIVEKKPVFSSKGGKKRRVGTRVIDSDGKTTVLLTPSGKCAKAALELRENKRYTNDGQVKTDKNGKPLTLNARQRAYRAGMLQHSQDNAKCYNAKK